MWHKREQQGLRLSEPDLYAVPEQEERIPTVPEPMAICIPKSVQWRQEICRRERLPQIQETAIF